MGLNMIQPLRLPSEEVLLEVEHCNEWIMPIIFNEKSV